MELPSYNYSNSPAISSDIGIAPKSTSDESIEKQEQPLQKRSMDVVASNVESKGLDCLNSPQDPVVSEKPHTFQAQGGNHTPHAGDIGKVAHQAMPHPSSSPSSIKGNVTPLSKHSPQMSASLKNQDLMMRARLDSPVRLVRNVLTESPERLNASLEMINKNQKMVDKENKVMKDLTSMLPEGKAKASIQSRLEASIKTGVLKGYQKLGELNKKRELMDSKYSIYERPQVRDPKDPENLNKLVFNDAPLNSAEVAMTQKPGYSERSAKAKREQPELSDREIVRFIVAGDQGLERQQIDKEKVEVMPDMSHAFAKLYCDPKLLKELNNLYFKEAQSSLKSCEKLMDQIENASSPEAKQALKQTLDTQFFGMKAMYNNLDKDSKIKFHKENKDFTSFDNTMTQYLRPHVQRSNQRL